MLEQLLNHLPSDPTPRGLAIAVCGALIGLVLWLAGATFSRNLLCLGAVAGGAAVGLALVRQRGWGVEPMGPAIALAVVAGTAAYLLHNAAVALVLGSTLAAIVGLLLWHGHGEPQIPWPAIGFLAAPEAWFHSVWGASPTHFRESTAAAMAGAFAAGAILTVLWPRAGTVSLYVAIGLGLLVTLGTWALAWGMPGGVRWIPQNDSAKVAILAGLAVVGALSQWRLLPDGNEPSDA